MQPAWKRGWSETIRGMVIAIFAGRIYTYIIQFESLPQASVRRPLVTIPMPFFERPALPAHREKERG